MRQTTANANAATLRHRCEEALSEPDGIAQVFFPSLFQLPQYFVSAQSGMNAEKSFLPTDGGNLS